MLSVSYGYVCVCTSLTSLKFDSISHLSKYIKTTHIYVEVTKPSGDYSIMPGGRKGENTVTLSYKSNFDTVCFPSTVNVSFS